LGLDFGVDLVAKKGGQWFAVQCKRSGKPVGIPAVQQVFSGAAHYHCKASIVVSNQEFTPARRGACRPSQLRINWSIEAADDAD